MADQADEVAERASDTQAWLVSLVRRALHVFDEFVSSEGQLADAMLETGLRLGWDLIWGIRPAQSLV